MKTIRGGYANLDLKGLDIKIERTVAGIYNEVLSFTRDVNKPIIIHNMVYDSERQNDTYVTDVIIETNKVSLIVSGLKVEITSANKIVATEYSAGGTDVEANPELQGGEDNLTSIKIGDEIYKITGDEVQFIDMTLLLGLNDGVNSVDKSDLDDLVASIDKTKPVFGVLRPTASPVEVYVQSSVSTISPTMKYASYLFTWVAGNELIRVSGGASYTEGSEPETINMTKKVTDLESIGTAITWGRGTQSRTPYEISVDLSASNIATVSFKYLDSEDQEVTTAYLPASMIGALLGRDTVSSEVIMQVSALVTQNGTPEAFVASVKFVTSPNGIATLMTSGSGYVDDGTYKGVITLVAEDQDNSQNFVIKAVKGTNLS